MIKEKLAWLKTFSPGWLNGEGDVFDPVGLDWLERVYLEKFSAKTPYVFPALAGKVRFEWVLTPHDVSLDISLATHKAYLHYMNMDTGEFWDKTLDLDKSNSWKIIEDSLQGKNNQSIPK